MSTSEHTSGSALANMKAFNPCRYIVWTQAGFKQACRMLHAAVEDTEDECPVEGYPKAYPSLVVFSEGYRGYHYWQAVCTPLSKAIERARVQLAFLEDADTEHLAAIAKTTGSA